MGRTRLMEGLWSVYGPLEDCMVHLRPVWKAVELTNHDFPSPGWKIAIGSLSTSALATFKDLIYDWFGASFGR